MLGVGLADVVPSGLDASAELRARDCGPGEIICCVGLADVVTSGLDASAELKTRDCGPGDETICCVGLADVVASGLQDSAERGEVKLSIRAKRVAVLCSVRSGPV